MADVTLSRQKELKEPDSFIVLFNKILKLIRENKKKFYTILFSVIFIILMISAFFLFKSYKANKVEQEHINLMKKYEAVVEIDGFEKTYTQFKPEVDNFLKKYGDTKIGKLFRLTQAHHAYEMKEYNRALSFYLQSLEDFKDDQSLISIIQSDIGLTYESMGDYGNALKYFAMVIEDINGLAKDEALFHLGYLYNKLNVKESSKRAFSDLVKNFPNSFYVEILQEKLNNE